MCGGGIVGAECTMYLLYVDREKTLAALNCISCFFGSELFQLYSSIFPLPFTYRLEKDFALFPLNSSIFHSCKMSILIPLLLCKN